MHTCLYRHIFIHYQRNTKKKINKLLGSNKYHLGWSILRLQVWTQSYCTIWTLDYSAFTYFYSCSSCSRSWIHVFITDIYHSIYQSLIYLLYLFKQCKISLQQNENKLIVIICCRTAYVGQVAKASQQWILNTYEVYTTTIRRD